MNHYETVFILNPVLSDTQIKETVQKFEDYLVSRGAEMISKAPELFLVSLPIVVIIGSFALFQYRWSLTGRR